MSLIPIGLSVAAVAALDLINPVLFLQRNIGGFVADVTVEEIHLDTLEITRNPVEQGAAVTDHAYKDPPAVIIKTGWSNSSPQAQGDPNFVNDTYQQFLDLQLSRQPFDIVTGKRSYSNMLISRLQVRTDETTEDALMMECECREFIFVNTQTVTVPNANMASPEATGNTLSRGTITVRPTANFNSNSVSP
jgi:Dit-like tail protein